MRMNFLNLRNFLILFLLSQGFMGTLRAQCYELVWAEEFEKAGLPDPKTWTMESGGGGWGNDELEYYRANDTNNCVVSNGTLKIRALKESYGGRDYTSARIKTQNKASFVYGKLEARIKMPYGQGIWPAFWMLGQNISTINWPACGEIDIVEMIGGTNRDNTAYGTIHWASNGTHAMSGSSKKLPSGILADDFHLYSVEWSQTSIKVLLDGVQYHEVNITPASMAAFHLEHFFLLNLAVGGKWPGVPDASTVFPQVMEVDYVRVYKGEGQILLAGKKEVYAGENNVRFSIDTLQGRKYAWSLPDGASLLSPADSNVVLVKWGCTAGDITCRLFTSCDTFDVKLPVAVKKNELIGSMFFDPLAASQKYTLPYYPNTIYQWYVPEGVSVLAGADSSTITLDWGEKPGLLAVKISNECFSDSLSKEILRAGQYPYPNPYVKHPVPGTIQSVEFDYGGEGVAYHDTEKANQGGGPRLDERVDTQNGAANPNIGYIMPSEWLEYTVAVKDSGYYKITLKLASGNTSGMGPVRILVNNEQRIPDIAVPSTGSWTSYQNVTSRGLRLSRRDTLIRVMAVKGGYNLGPLYFVADPGYVGIDDRSKPNTTLNLSPNPASGSLRIESTLLNPGQACQLAVYDGSGRQRLGPVSHLAGSELDIRSLLPGVYMIRLSNEEGKQLNGHFIKN